MKETLQSKCWDLVEPHLQDGIIPPGSNKETFNRIHSKVVSDAISNLSPNRVLNRQSAAASTSHLFSCNSHPTNLTTTDLWERPWMQLIISRTFKALTVPRLLGLHLLDVGMAGDLPLKPLLHPNLRVTVKDGLACSINSVSGGVSSLFLLLLTSLIKILFFCFFFFLYCCFQMFFQCLSGLFFLCFLTILCSVCFVFCERAWCVCECVQVGFLLVPI